MGANFPALELLALYTAVSFIILVYSNQFTLTGRAKTKTKKEYERKMKETTVGYDSPEEGSLFIESLFCSPNFTSEFVHPKLLKYFSFLFLS